jgi:hypothetical protein
LWNESWRGQRESKTYERQITKVEQMTYKVIRWQTDGTEEIWEAPKKPTFPDMYKLINCTTIERQSGYDKNISNRTFDMWCDEDSKKKGDEFIKKNERATNAWYTWMNRTGHKCMHDDFIAGNVVVYKKI